METEEKGICRLSNMPVRKEGADQSEMVTQLLFGEHYVVHEWSKNKKWLKITIAYDGYSGWIDHRQHTPISQAYFEQINHSNYKLCTDLTSSILFRKEPVTIVIGSVLPISTSELFKMEEQLAFNGEAEPMGVRKNLDFLLTMANKYLHAPYLWGGRTPFGIDCSGFSQIVYRLAGYSLKRDASQQAQQGKAVGSLDESLPGDLAFFQNEKGSITHVGIIKEDRKIIHASGRVRVDAMENEGIADAESGKLTHTFHSIRRILQP